MVSADCRRIASVAAAVAARCGRSYPPCAVVWAIVSVDICVCCASFGSGSGQLYRARIRWASERRRWPVAATARRLAALPDRPSFGSTRCGSCSISSNIAVNWLCCPVMLASRYAFHSGSLVARHCGWLWNDTRSYSGPCSAT